MCRRFLVTLLLLVFSTPLYAKGGGESGGSFIPATPPVNVHTSVVKQNYTGWGYMNFDVKLPEQMWPEFTLGGDEDAKYELGDAQYYTQSIAYIDEGRRGLHESEETAWLLGTLKAEMADDSFTFSGTKFNTTLSKSGYVFGRRTTSAKRLYSTDRIILDYSFTSLYAGYWLTGDKRIESSDGAYLDDISLSAFGVAYRPMLVLQPRIMVTSWMDVVPFVGASAFIFTGPSWWEVNEWKDQVYADWCGNTGNDSGCDGMDWDFGIIPLETFWGFDVELDVSDNGTLSISSLFSASIATDTASMSEVYVVYTYTTD
jgi:hypothetical protein